MSTINKSHRPSHVRKHVIRTRVTTHVIRDGFHPSVSKDSDLFGGIVKSSRKVYCGHLTQRVAVRADSAIQDSPLLSQLWGRCGHLLFLGRARALLSGRGWRKCLSMVPWCYDGCFWGAWNPCRFKTCTCRDLLAG